MVVPDICSSICLVFLTFWRKILYRFYISEEQLSENEITIVGGDVEQRERAMISLERVGLGEKAKSFPSQLSGGQQQRASIARALAGNPSVILADEPTGALDSKTGREVMEFLKELHKEGNTIVLITHDNSIAAQAERVVRITDGKIVYDGPAEGDEMVSKQDKAGAL